MWQNILVIAIVALTTGLVAWNFYRKLTGKSSGCGGCSAAGSSCCGSGGTEGSGRAPAHASSSASLQVRPLKGSGCGCGH